MVFYELSYFTLKKKLKKKCLKSLIFCVNLKNIFKNHMHQPGEDLLHTCIIIFNWKFSFDVILQKMSWFGGYVQSK